jgi:hypothetical protein
MFIDIYFNSTSFVPFLVRFKLLAAIKDGTFMVNSGNSNGAFDVRGQFRKAYSLHRQRNYRIARYFYTKLYNPQELSVLKTLAAIEGQSLQIQATVLVAISLLPIREVT